MMMNEKTREFAQHIQHMFVLLVCAALFWVVTYGMGEQWQDLHDRFGIDHPYGLDLVFKGQLPITILTAGVIIAGCFAVRPSWPVFRWWVQFAARTVSFILLLTVLWAIFVAQGMFLQFWAMSEMCRKDNVEQTDGPYSQGAAKSGTMDDRPEATDAAPEKRSS